MRPPSSPLHPRSRFTSSLFATTLFASFFIVALPHVLPCPAPRGAFTDDGSPTTRRRRRKVIVEAQDQGDAAGREGEESKHALRADTLTNPESGSGVDGDLTRTSRSGGSKRTARACPVPKPGGLLGEMLGFKAQQGPSPPIIPSQWGSEEGGSEATEIQGASRCPMPAPRSQPGPGSTPGAERVGENLGFKKISTPRRRGGSPDTVDGGEMERQHGGWSPPP